MGLTPVGSLKQERECVTRAEGYTKGPKVGSRPSSSSSSKSPGRLPSRGHCPCAMGRKRGSSVRGWRKFKCGIFIIRFPGCRLGAPRLDVGPPLSLPSSPPPTRFCPRGLRLPARDYRFPLPAHAPHRADLLLGDISTFPERTCLRKTKGAAHRGVVSQGIGPAESAGGPCPWHRG